ncbi:MAG: class I SAM-dependent methyltransferase [Burkholderiales bacterium]
MSEQDRAPSRITASENWDRLAKFDAMWTILSDSTKLGGKWDREEFFATGAGIFARLDAIERLGARINYGVAVDFGCGVGRVSQWLAKRFSRVVGVDISPRMLELAERYNTESAAITFVLGNEVNVPLATSSADLVYSFIVLQHIGKAMQQQYLREFSRIARPGGYLCFQVPSHPLDGGKPNFSVGLMTDSGPATIEINTYPRAEVESHLESCGCKIVGVLNDDSCGSGMKSYFYVAQKQS